MTETSITALQELVIAAIDDISILLGTPENEQEPDSFILMTNIHLDNITMAAELCERQGLQLLCESFQQSLSSEGFIEKHEELTTEELILKWLFSLSGYIETPDDETLINSLLTVFDTEQAEILRDILLLELENISASESVPLESQHSQNTSDFDSNFPTFSDSAFDVEDIEEDEDEDDEFDPSSFNTFEIINMFLDEFIDMASSMDSIISNINVENYLQDSSQQYLANYQELIDRVILTTKTLQLKGLGEVCEFVKHNIAMLGSLASLEEKDFNDIIKLLSGWNAPVIEYLRNPSDDTVCIQLIKYLEDIHWPEPLLDKQAKEVLVLLIEGLEDLSNSDSENNRQDIASTDDVSLNISSDVSEALLEAFFHEVPTLAVEFTAHIERLVNGDQIQKNTESAQRLAHTIKGSANLIGAAGIANLTHHLEDILEYLARNNTTPPEHLAELLQESADTIEAMIESLQGISDQPQEAQQILQSVLDWANRIDQGDLTESTKINISTITSETETMPVENINNDNIKINNIKINNIKNNNIKTKSQPKERVEVLHVPVSQVDEMFRLVGEMSIAMGQMQEQIKGLINEGESLNTHDMVVQQRRFDLENLIDIKNVTSRQRRLRTVSNTQRRFDPLEMDEYDEVHGAVHSYIESVADSRSIGQQLGLQSHKLDGLLAQQNLLYNELQQIVMSTRMVPVESITARLQRSVRQASRATGKKVLLEITGTELNIDGDVLSQLTAPLMHMLRNAVDHGVEDTEQRIAAGKPEQGLISLNFTQQGNQVIVNCIDDGRGLDYELIRSLAEDKGLVLNGQLLSKNETARLILQPGFTTKTSATHISGRGVGMDVVNSTITGLKGTLEIEESEINNGSHFILRLPITLVTNHSVLAAVENELFAIPTSSLLQVLTPGIGEFGTLGNDLTYQLDKDVYPARYLSQMYNINIQNQELNPKSMYTLLVRFDTGIVAVIVDNVVDSHELVVKDMGRYVKSVKGISGISVLGNGDVIPVLDLPEQLRSASHTTVSNSLLQNTQAQPVKHIPRVLIVDDSLSVRQSLSQLIEDAGFDAQLARDGIEAMDMIREQMPDIVLADMEMPRMNGLELTSALRSNNATTELPVIMITSRSMQKHRDEAEKAGVNMYMTKPFAEDILLSNIHSQIRSAS